MTGKYVVLDIEATGLVPWYGDRVTCICAKDSAGHRFKMYHEDEEKLVEAFLAWLRERDPEEHLLVSKNGKLFDIPFILARLALKCALTPGSGLFLLSYRHFDLHELTAKWVTLNDMARLLRCTPKSGTGENAVLLWEERRYQELVDYCMQDVETTEQVYLAYKRSGSGNPAKECHQPA